MSHSLPYYNELEVKMFSGIHVKYLNNRYNTATQGIQVTRVMISIVACSPPCCLQTKGLTSLDTVQSLEVLLISCVQTWQHVSYPQYCVFSTVLLRSCNKYIGELITPHWHSSLDLELWTFTANLVSKFPGKYLEKLLRKFWSKINVMHKILKECPSSRSCCST